MSKRPRSLSIATTKREFSDILGAVRHRGERFVIERRGTPVAAIVPIGDLERLEGNAGPGFLALVGAFADAPGLPEALDQAVKDRRLQRKRRAPRLPA